MDPFGDQAMGGIPASITVASQNVMADEIVDVLLGGVAGAFGYAGPFCGGELALKVFKQEGKNFRLALIDGIASYALPEPCLGRDDVKR